MMRKAAAMLFLALLTLFSTTTAFGQAVYGNIVGTVTDQSGAAVPNAKVTITDTGRGVSVNTTTNESGNFTQRFLIVGRYQVRVEVQGFKVAVQEVGVSVDQEVSLDIKLQPGQVSEEVTITSEAPLLKTERADVAITFSEKTLTNLPLLNRRFTSVEIFTPGVTAWPAQTAASEDPQGSFRKVVNGQSFAGTSHLLDGTDNHDALLGLIVINPTMESITEAKVTTSAYDAEFGANAGVVSSQTKSGTNDLHFSVFEFLRNDHFNARNPFTQFNPIRGTNNRYIPVTQINQFGGAASGKIIPNKLFWFGDYQGTRRNIGGSVITRVRRRLNARAISAPPACRTFSIRRAALLRRGARSFNPTARITSFQPTGFRPSRWPC